MCILCIQINSDNDKESPRAQNCLVVVIEKVEAHAAHVGVHLPRECRLAFRVRALLPVSVTGQIHESMVKFIKKR